MGISNTMTFGDWQDGVCNLAVQYGMENPRPALDWSAWRSYYDDGLSPSESWDAERDASA